MTEEEDGLFIKDKRAAFYLKIILMAKRMHVIFLYFCIAMNVLIVGMTLLGKPNVGILFFVMNTWFLLFLMLKLRREKRNV